MQYSIIKGITLDILVSTVNEQLLYGWIPLGAPVIEINPDHPPIFYQAMINEHISNDD